MDDRTAMERCLALARQAVARGNEPFGSVIVLDGRVIAEGENAIHTDLDPTAHAEIVAIRRACRSLGRVDLSGATVYASGEPCWMCSTAIRHVGAARVVFAAASRRGSGGYTSVLPILSADVAGGQRPPEVVANYMADEAAAMFAEVGWPRPPK